MRYTKINSIKICFCIFICFLFNLNAQANVEFQLNKINSFYIFSEAIIGIKNRPKVHKKLYLQSYKNNKQLEQKREKLALLYKKIKRARIYNHAKTKSLLSAIIIESTFVKSIQELESKILNNYETSIKKEEFRRYFRLLKPFLPVFEQLIWNPNYPRMVNIKNDLIKLSQKINTNKMMKNIAHFYHLKPKNIRTLYVSLYPIPEGKSFSALRIENTAPVGVIIKNNKLNLEWMLSAVVLHEYCHELYGVNKKKILKMIASYDPNITKDKDFKKVFDESMQTSISAGFIYSKLTGKLFKGPWYNNTTYDLFAKLMHGEILRYLEKNRKIDNAFIKKSLTIYSQIK